MGFKIDGKEGLCYSGIETTANWTIIIFLLWQKMAEE